MNIEGPVTPRVVTIYVTMKGHMILYKNLAETDLTSCIKAIKKQLVVTHTIRIGHMKTTKTIPAYRDILIRGTNAILIARHFNIECVIKAECLAQGRKTPLPVFIYNDQRPEGVPIEADLFLPGIELYHNQQVALDTVIENEENGRRIGGGGTVLVMDTGTGKTYCGGAFIAYHKRKTLIIVPNHNALTEWTKMLQSYPALTIGQYHGKMKVDGHVVIMTINSAVSDTFDFPKGTMLDVAGNQFVGTVPYYRYFALFGTIIFDEAHSYPTSTRTEIFWRTSFMHSLALTATPDEREDNMHKVLPMFLGQVVRGIDMPDYEDEEIKWLGKVRVASYVGPAEYTRHLIRAKTGWMDWVAMTEQASRDPYRNDMIMGEIERLYMMGHNTYVFSSRREHLTHMRELLATKTVIPLKESAVVMGGIDIDAKKLALDTARVIFVTYGYGSQSMSSGRMDAIVYATPHKSGARQKIGRILRRNGDTSIVRQIVDIVDTETGLAKQYKIRRSSYKEKKFDIERVEYSWTSFSTSIVDK